MALAYRGRRPRRLLVLINRSKGSPRPEDPYIGRKQYRICVSSRTRIRVPGAVCGLTLDLLCRDSLLQRHLVFRQNLRAV